MEHLEGVVRGRSAAGVAHRPSCRPLSSCAPLGADAVARGLPKRSAHVAQHEAPGDARSAALPTAPAGPLPRDHRLAVRAELRVEATLLDVPEVRSEKIREVAELEGDDLTHRAAAANACTATRSAANF